jgi:protein-tyrosine phosphatase
MATGPDPRVTSRRATIDGLSNFRDLGGIPAGEHVVRTGLVYRSDSPHQVTEEGLAVLLGLGIASVLDLRTAEERGTNPGPLPSDHHPIQEHFDGVDPRSASGVNAGERVLRDTYVLLLDDAPDRFGRVLAQLADPGRLPAVVHCAAGKDRTGLVVALLLSVLGVERDTVLDDYALERSGPEFEARLALVHARFVEMGIESGVAWGMIGTPRWAMADALEHLDDRYGSVAAYVTGPCAVPVAAVERLRAALLE